MKHVMTEWGIKNKIGRASVELAAYTAGQANAPENVLQVLNDLQSAYPFIVCTELEKVAAHDRVLEATEWCRNLSASDRANLHLRNLTLTMEYALNLVAWAAETNPYEIGYGLDACDKALELVEGWRHY